MQIFQKLFSPEFTTVMDTLISQDSFIDKVREKFDIFIQLMNTKSELIKPFLLKMCINNVLFGEWVINKQLLSLEAGKEQIQVLNEIIKNRKS